MLSEAVKRKAETGLAMLTHVFLPNRCMFCNRPIAYNGRLCPKCDACKPLIRAAEPSCTVDGLDRLVSPFWYELGADRAVWNLKFSGDFTCARKLAFYMACAWRAAEYTRERMQTDADIDLILPVPLYKRDYRRRGFNQSEQLAIGISRELNIPFCTNGLQKIRPTKTQHELDRAERRDNLRNAYCAIPEKVAAKHILLVDDVYTTGATLAECAAALRNAGAAGVSGLTATRTRAKAEEASS